MFITRILEPGAKFVVFAKIFPVKSIFSRKILMAPKRIIF